jgi:hypothetical protein
VIKDKRAADRLKQLQAVFRKSNGCGKGFINEQYKKEELRLTPTIG